MLFQIKSYLKFLWYSKNEHAVHSPFVFNLITKCFYNNKPKPEYEILKNYRNSLLENKSTIVVTDFGVGSKVFKSNVRQINKIVRTAGISPKRTELLFRITDYFQPNTILEIGTSLGLATSALALGNPNAKITTLEGCPETAKIAQLHLEKLSSRACHPERSQATGDNINTIELIISEFQSYLENCRFKTENYHLIIFDGNHSKKATLAYFELLLPTVCNESVWIFDDIHWSQEMESAWEIIKSHPKVMLTIDTFQWGLIFFRNEQRKEHFIIRT